MAQPVIQTSFNSGEWAPSLNARVDLKQYHAGAAMLRNFFVDYRGGATKSPGTKYVLQTITTGTVRVIRFQASQTVSYVLVFEAGKLWFVNNAAPVLEIGKTITNITQNNPGVVTSNAHGYSNGDRVFISGVVGMTQVNGNYYTVAGAAANTFQLADLSGNLVNTTGFTAYSSGGTAQRIYTLTSPYAASELFGIKYAQDVNVMILCHPNYAPYSLTLTSATSWTLAAITIGSTVSAPTGQAVTTTGGAGSTNQAYIITAVDANGQESGPSAFATLSNVVYMDTSLGASNIATNTVTWSTVTGAVSYNVYKAAQRITTAVPAGAMFGFVGNTTSTTFHDTMFDPDFSQNYPQVRNPFSGSGVQSVAVTAGGSYTSGFVPTVSFSGGGGGTGAAAFATANITSLTIPAGGFRYTVGDLLSIPGSGGAIVRVTSVGPGSGDILSLVIVNAGNLTSGTALPVNPVSLVNLSVTDLLATGGQVNLTWTIVSVGITSPGSGYGPAPTVVFSSGAATATATLGTPSFGNPTVPGFYQQRLVLAGPVANPRQFNMSQPGTYYNFNVTDPTLPDNAFQGTLVSGTLNTITALIGQPQGLAVLSDQGAWLVNGGSAGSAADATNIVSNPQIFSGCAGPQPIVAAEDIIYVQSKTSIVRNMAFNWNKQIYGGTDISALSSHLFYGFQMIDLAWAEEPFKIAWFVRSDGVMLSLTFLKEQELIAWSTRNTNGSFKSVASVTESGALGFVDAVYVVAQRTINGATVNYIERMMEQYYPVGATNAWQVDAGLQYNGAATTTFTGANHLLNTAITGLATDDTGVVTVFTATVSASGGFTIAAPASPATGYTRVTAGLAYTAQLQTLAIDTGDPTIQGKMKLLPAVTVRVKDTLGLEIGTTFDTLVDMDDLVIGNIGKDTNEVVTSAMVTGDALQALDPQWQEPGQYCIQSSDPWPATILGLIPQIAIGDTPK